MSVHVVISTHHATGLAQTYLVITNATVVVEPQGIPGLEEGASQPIASQVTIISLI